MLVFTTDAVYQNIFTYVKIFLFMFGILLIDVWCFSLFACNIEYAKVKIVRYLCRRTFVPRICYDGLSIHLETNATRGIVFNDSCICYHLHDFTDRTQQKSFTFCGKVQRIVRYSIKIPCVRQ